MYIRCVQDEGEDDVHQTPVYWQCVQDEGEDDVHQTPVYWQPPP